MRKEDIICLEIENIIRDGFKQLYFTIGIEDNIINVFYHELMKYATNYYLIRNSTYKYDYPIRFPFLNKKFIKSPFLFDSSYLYNINTQKESFFHKTLKIINLIKKNDREVSINNLYLSKENLLNILLSNIKITPLNYPPFYYAKRKRIQIEALESILTKVFNYLDEKKPVYIKNFISYISNFTTDKQEVIKENFLLLGSPSILGNRINAANFRLQNKKVIATAHGGNSNTRFDEPIVGYGELSLVDYYIDFGGNNDYLTLEYGKPLGKTPKLFHLSSKKFEKILKKKFIPFKRLDKNLKVAYLPTGFSLNMRYGPFRDIDDELYLEWQKALFKVDLNLIYKVHPNHFNKDLSFASKKEYKNLFLCVDNFDFFIVDYIGTAHAIAAATDKPILYFNLGLRNMSQNFLKQFKKRVFWYDIDFNEDFFDQIIKAIDLYNMSGRSFINEFTEGDSLADVQYIKDILSKIL